MAKRDPNRIQVDLKLLQDKNLRALKEFGDQFSASVDRLAGVLERGGDFGAGGGGGTPGRARRSRPGDPAASTAPTNEAPGQPPPPGSRTQRGANWLAQQGYGGPNITEFEKSQFNLGNIGQMDAMAQMRYLSHILQKPGYDDQGNELPGALRGGLRHVGGALGAFPRGHTYLQSARGLVAQVANFGLGPASFGQNLGRSRQSSAPLFGMLGLPILSPAWRTGFGANIRADWRSGFGFNPNYSTAQAKEAMASVNQYGYDGQLANRLLGTMKNITQTTGLDASSQMQLFDPAMRFGTDSMQGVVDTLYQIPRAANAARMSVSQFTADLVSAAQSLAESGNMTMAGASKGLMAFSGATGLAPSKGAAILGDQRNLFMTSALTGRNIYDLTYGKHAMSERMKMPILIAEQAMGVPMSEWHRLKRQQPELYARRMSGLMYMQMQDPSLFGQFNIKDLETIANNPHVVNRTAAGETLQQLGTTKGMPNWNALMQQMGLSENGRANFRAYQAKLEGSNLSQQEIKKREGTYLSKALDRMERTSHENARARTLFDLTPDAKRMLKFMDKTQSKPTSNMGGSAAWYAEAAVVSPANRGHGG